MARRKVKKRLNFLKVIIFLLILYLLFNVAIKLSGVPIKSIIIKNTSYLTDTKVIEIAGLEDYPSYFRTSTLRREKKLEEYPLIKKADIKRKLNFAIEINVEEEKILYKKRNDNKYVLGSGKEVSLDNNISGIATLINYTPNDIQKKFNKKLNLIDDNILSKISEIEYSPNKTDDERFLLYMNDGNLVYITISKIKELNYYINIVKKLNNKKGILNLDSGNYFEVKE